MKELQPCLTNRSNLPYDKLLYKKPPYPNGWSKTMKKISTYPRELSTKKPPYPNGWSETMKKISTYPRELSTKNPLNRSIYENKAIFLPDELFAVSLSQKPIVQNPTNTISSAPTPTFVGFPYNFISFVSTCHNIFGTFS